MEIRNSKGDFPSSPLNTGYSKEGFDLDVTEETL